MIKVLATGSKGNSYAIQAGEEILLLECGISFNQIKRGINFKLNKVVGCLVTHHHKDHALSAKYLINDGITVHGTETLIEELEAKGKINRQRSFIRADKDTFRVGNFYIKAFKNYHKNSDGSECQCLGYLIKHKLIGTILFATDTYLIKPIFNNVTHILIECNYDDEENQEEHDQRRLESHMSLNSLKTFLERWEFQTTKNITLIHLSETRANKERMKVEIEELTKVPVIIAEKGLVINE